MSVMQPGRPSTSRARLGRLIAGIAASFAAVTCDLVTAPARGAGSSITVNYTGQDTLVVGTKVPFAVQVLQGAVPVEGAEVRLTTSDSAIIQVVDVAVGADTIIVRKRGQATLRGTLVGVTGDQPPFADVIIVGIAASLTVDSTSVTFRTIGDTVRLRASVFDTNGVLIDSVARWRSLNNAIASIDSLTGKLLARASGTTQIRAIVDLDTATLQVSVVQNLVRYRFSTPTLTITALNQDTVITVRPQDAGGAFIPHNTVGLPVPTFTSRNTGVATVTTLSDTTFRVSSLANDTTRVRIVAGTLDTTLFVSVGQLATSVVIQGATADTIDALQDTVRLRGRAFDARAVEVQGRSVIWTSLNTSVVTVDGNGLVTGQTLGTALVTARLDAALDTVPVTVQNNPRSITTPPSISLPTVGDSVLIGRTVLNRLGAPLVGAAIAWRALDTTIATVGATTGLLVARSIGNTAVIATITGGADTTLISVANNIATLQITQPDTTLASIGDTLSVRVDFRNARGAALAAGAAFWSSSDSSTVIVANGFVTALRQGFADIRATDPLNPARFAVVRLSVSNAPAVLTLNRVLDTLTAPSRTLQYVADVRNARGALLPAALVTFRTTNSSIASVTPNGLATALAVGTTSVIAEVGSGAGLRADTSTLVVTNDAVGMTLSPTDVTVASIGATIQLAADARNAVGGAVTGVTFLWSSSDPAVASVNGSGVVTGVSIGTAVVTARLAAVSASANITVSNAPDTINIGPTVLTFASVSDSVAPAVTLKNALGAALPRTAAQWVSDDAAVAVVTSDGTIIAAGRGATRVRARNATNTARQDSVSITVTDHPDSINVVRTVDVLPSLNRTIQYTADVFNARRRALLSEPVTWTVRNPTVATIASSGLATSVGIGQSYIVGAAGLAGVGAGIIADSALLVVSNSAASVAVSPTTLALVSLGETAQLTATARNELGTVIGGPAITWGTSNAAVATVSASGLVTAVGVGSASVSATVDGITTGVAVSVTNAPATVQITSGSLTLASLGDQATPPVTFTNSLGAALPRDAVIWTTSDANVITVSSLGVVTATGAGTASLTATSPANGAATSTVTVTVTNAPASLTIAPSGTTTLTAVGASVALTATIRNAAGAVVAAPNPAVTWSSNTAAVTVHPTTGVASAASPGSATITATAGAATASVTVTVAPVASAARSTISASTASLTANGAATATITVQLKDAGGTNLAASGGTVTMTLTGNGTLSAVTNNGNGTYTAVLTAPTTLGSGSVGAAIGSAAISSGDPLVTYLAGAATKYLVTSSGAAPVAGTAVTISAQLADAFNNPVTAARTVTWSSTGGGAFGAPTSATNASGIATVSFTTNTTAATSHLVTATDNLAVTGASAAIQTVPGAAANYLVTPASTSPAAGSGVTVTAQLRDVNNNAVSQPGQTVTWTKSNANGSFSSATSPTNAAGVASITLTTHTASGTATTVTATTGGITGTSGTVTTVPGAASPLTTTISAGVATLTAGTTTTITVQARDANGNNRSSSGGTVTLSASAGTVGAVTDNGNGTYSAIFTATTTGTATVSGTINGPNITATAAITVTTGAASAAQSTASVPTGVAGGVTTITVQTRDGAGNNRTTSSGTVAATITGANTAGGAVVDNTNGSYTITYTPTAAGSDAIAITLNGVPIGGSPYANVVVPGALAGFLVETAGGGALATQTAGTSFSVRITARDANGNTVSGFSGTGNTVTLTSSGALTGAPVVTGAFANGVLASQVLTITNTGAFTLTATRTSGGAQNGQSSFAVQAGAAAAAQSTAVVAAGTAGAPTTISVQAKDALGNNRTTTSGTVTATITGANAGASVVVVNNSDGTYTVSYTPTVTGADNVAILLGGVPISGSPFASAVSPGALHHFAVTNTSGGAIAGQTAGTGFAIQVTAQDANNNTVTSFTGIGNTVTIASTGTLTAGAGTTASFVNGVLASHAVTISNSGSFTITATRTAGGAQTGTSSAFTVAAGALDHFDVEESGGGIISTKTAGTTFSILVTARDVNNNTVTSFSGSGNKVNLTSTGTLTGAPLLTGNFTNGVLTSQPVTITNTGSFTITATRSGGPETGTSAAFTVNPGVLQRFAVTSALGGPITAKTAGLAFDPLVMVTAQDANGNTVTSFTGPGNTVTITSTGNLTVGGGVKSGFVNGVLPNLAVTISNTGLFSITATRTSGGTQTGTSNTFPVN